MRIDSASIAYYTQRLALEQTVTKESLKVWVGPQRPDFEGRHLPLSPSGAGLADTLSISSEARAKLAGLPPPDAAPVRAVAPTAEQDEVELDPKTRLLKLIVERLTGRKLKLLSLHHLQGGAWGRSRCLPEQAQGNPRPRQGFGVEYDRYQRYDELERTDFVSTGVIRTADGQEISFSIGLSMSREFASEERIRVRAGDAVVKDPLVINFDGNAASLSDVQFNFDLDADGQVDRLSFLGPGSGFLVLDANGDGVVNDGRELFGPSTGSGFGELATYDVDGNGWIDEGDPVFATLQVWTKDAQGNDLLVPLAERGVGALCVAAAQTPFSLKDEGNELLGEVKASGIYVNENGTVGTIQQVDLALAETPTEPVPEGPLAGT